MNRYCCCYGVTVSSPVVRWGLIKYLAALPLLPSHTFVSQTNTNQSWPSLSSPDLIAPNQRHCRTSHIFVRVKYGFQEEYYQRSLTFLYNGVSPAVQDFQLCSVEFSKKAAWCWMMVWGCEDINPWQEVMRYDESPPRNNLQRGRETQIIIFSLVTPHNLHIILH